MNSITSLLTKSEWISKIQAWSEQTTTSPSGYHLGHSKVLIADHDLQPDTYECQILEEKRSQLIDWQIDLINMAIVNGSYDRWAKIINS